MRFSKQILPVVAGACGLALTLLAQQPRETLAWAPQPVENPGWVAPNKPIWKLSELLAQHKGQPNWKETVVSDTTLHADYVSMAPGTKTPRMFHPDNRAWWIVQDGQIRFSIEGQEPFVATKGYMVQVPYRNIFSLEVVGDKPALFVAVNIAGDTILYPLDEQPSAMPGFNFVKVRISGKGKYEGVNKPYTDFAKIVSGAERPGRFVGDDRAVANIIRGMPQNPKDVDKGHFHEVSSEFWFILEGQIEYKIGSLPILIADQGDIVYAPKQMWHRATHAGTGWSTRLAMNGYQDLLHDYQPSEELNGK
jgi:mannose-6-phosphate isomerase-like protein (cupin superfamily)